MLQLSSDTGNYNLLAIRAYDLTNMHSIFVIFCIFDNMKTGQNPPSRRIILVYWKNKQNNPFEVFSNLKNFCASYPQYNYNTLNNYLSKEKKPFENEVVRVERKPVLTTAKQESASEKRLFRMAPVVRKGRLSDIDEAAEDLAYWQSKSPKDRIAAVTFIISQSLEPGARLDKTALVKRKAKV